MVSGRTRITLTYVLIVPSVFYLARPSAPDEHIEPAPIVESHYKSAIEFDKRILQRLENRHAIEDLVHTLDPSDPLYERVNNHWSDGMLDPCLAGDPDYLQVRRDILIDARN